MMFLLGVLVCIVSVTAEFGLNFRDATSSFNQTFDSPIDFTNGYLEFMFDIDIDHYDEITASASVSQLNIIQLNSNPDASGNFDTLLVDLFLTQEGALPMLMITFSTPLSSGDVTSPGGYCVILPPYDYLNQPLKLSKTGGNFTMLNMAEGTFYCENSAIGAPDTGAMTFSSITIGPDFKGCLSKLELPSYSAIPEAECDAPLPGVVGDVVYFEGTCAMEEIPSEDHVCPTTPPTEPPTEPATEPPTEPPTEPATSGGVTTATWSTSSFQTTTQSVTLPAPDTQPPTDDEDGDGYNINDVEDDDDDDEDSNEIVEEAAVGSDSGDSNNIIIIIAIVSASVIVVVIVLFVGYRWHYRDKGSYKLEDGKAAEANGDGDEFGNEYTDLTGAQTKDQEWYL